MRGLGTNVKNKKLMIGASSIQDIKVSAIITIVVSVTQIRK